MSKSANSKQTEKQSLRVAACQMLTRSDVERNTQRIVERLMECAEKRVEIAAFHEGVLYGFECDAGFWATFDQSRLDVAEETIAHSCAEYEIAAVVGSSHVENGNRYNSLALINEHGQLVGRYSKTHLAGEEWCIPGRKIPIYTLCGVPCCFIICHDVRYPELVRLPAGAGAQVCFYCGAGSSLVYEYKLSAYRAMPISRATENSIYLVMTNAPADPRDIDREGSSHGNSKIVHPNGIVLAEAGMLTEETLVCDLDLSAATRKFAMRAVEDETCLQTWIQAGVNLVETHLGK